MGILMVAVRSGRSLYRAPTLASDWRQGAEAFGRSHTSVLLGFVPLKRVSKTRRAEDWVGALGRARKLADAKVSKDKQRVGAVVCVKAKNMKDAWHLTASVGAATAREIINLYSRRWTIEPGFRDTKDLRFGMGLGSVRIGDPYRRDRLLLLNAIAIVLLTLLGGAGEALGMDRLLKSNTVKRRVHSLFRQGCLYYDAIPNMPEQKLCALMERFQALFMQHKVAAAVFALV
jgi:hypothetical protein